MNSKYLYTPGICLLALVSAYGQNNDSHRIPGFFNDYWQPVEAVTPDFIEQELPDTIPEMVIRVNPADTLIRISPLVGGYNLNTFFGGKYYDKAGLLEHMRNLDMPFYRFPGGSGSNFYFWDAIKPDRPADVDSYLVKGVEKTTVKWGDEPGKDYLSLDNYYRLRDSTKSHGIHVINYSYARYGTSANPVQQAAHYAAQWVRHDNGKTKFWEIGNENYGKWEAGYEIDTSKNQDGQPRVLTASLYAEHCKIFMDSMRAAAVEIGTEIKIGAVIGFKSQYNTWNRTVLDTLGNDADFYSIHKYYGNHNDADARDILNDISQFYSDKSYIDGLIGQYCDPLVPLVETEWNTRYSGRNQNVSCTNGLFSMLGFKGIIHTGIGLSSRWNLVWGYQDGDSHGLISNKKDNPAVEGLPAYSPRAPFFYTYFFRKVLGDVAVNSTPSSAGDLDLFSSAFGSGHVGVVIVNKGNRSISTALNIENFEAGERYYWYTLSPTGDDPFSREVKVNGYENSEYDAGGPASYSSIEAFSAPIEDGILLTLPPYSASYILAEGSTVLPPQGHPCDFTIYGRTREGVLPLEGAMIQVAGKYYLTENTGQVSMELSEGNYTYYLDANGYQVDSGNMLIEGPLSISDTLENDNPTVDIRQDYLKSSAGEFMLFPNPADKKVTLKNDIAFSRLEIFDSSGKSVMSERDFRSNEYVADLRSFSEGIYFIKIEDLKGNEKTEKLIIKYN